MDMNKWQAQTETTAAAFARLIDDFAAVRAGDLARKRQSKPRSLDAAAQGIMRAVELLENPLLAARRHAQAAIQDADFRMRQRFGLGTQLEGDVLATVRVFFRV